MSVDILYTAKSRNEKIGNVPQMWIGSSTEQTVKSCLESGCPLLSKRYGGQDGQVSPTLKLKPCYAYNGRTYASAKSVHRAFEKGKDYSLENAIARSARMAKIFRVTGLGDPSIVPPSKAKRFTQKVREAGMKVKGFTAGWRIAKHWKGILMASTYTLEQADEAIAKGWRASTVLPSDFIGTGRKKNQFVTPAGNKGVVCPQQMGSAVDCNTCRLCVAENKGPIIGFINHL